MSYKVFEIPQTYIPTLDKQNCKGWDIFDDECERNDLVLDNHTLNQILELSGEHYAINHNHCHLAQHIKYNLKNENYHITEHNDNTEYTIIIYLDKSPDISDKFWVNNTMIREDVWNPSKTNYKAIIFWGNASHYGYIFGNGKRELLCIFSQSLWGPEYDS